MQKSDNHYYADMAMIRVCTRHNTVCMPNNVTRDLSDMNFN